MKYMLNTTNASLNKKIKALNTANEVETPHLAGLVMSARGAASCQDFQVRYDRLEDGCHPHSYIIEKWQKTISEIAFANRVNTGLFLPLLNMCRGVA